MSTVMMYLTWILKEGRTPYLPQKQQKERNKNPLKIKVTEQQQLSPLKLLAGPRGWGAEKPQLETQVVGCLAAQLVPKSCIGSTEP